MTNKEIFNLDGKVAIITGASKGIGEGIAQLLATFGAKVVVSSRKLADVQVVADLIIANGGEAIAVEAHAGDEAQLNNLVKETIKAYGGIDILVNNAATNPVYGPTLECPSSAFDKIMQINVKAPFYLANLCHESMKSRGGGSIINISSIAGHTPDPGLGIYSVSKAALNMLTKVQAKEWGKDNIRINAICPGLIKTKFSQALWENEKTLNHFTKNLPIARMGDVDEIAPMALFLASGASSYCTGQLMSIDGGTII
jgi:NAD(P)-dependent dehydrogenase (short-subunit alcohol dehydrogenase family)